MGFAPNITPQVKSKIGRDPSPLPCSLGLLTCRMLLSPVPWGCSRRSAHG